VSINYSLSVIWKITPDYLNCDERYCVLGVMSDGKWVRGVPVPSRVVMCVKWQLDKWRARQSRIVMYMTWQWNLWKRQVEPKRGISIRGISIHGSR
jgi:hypothetical protein